MQTINKKYKKPIIKNFIKITNIIKVRENKLQGD